MGLFNNKEPITGNGTYDMSNIAYDIICDISGEFDGAELSLFRLPDGHPNPVKVATITHDGESINWQIASDITLKKDDGIVIQSARGDTYRLHVANAGAATALYVSLHEYRGA